MKEKIVILVYILGMSMLLLTPAFSQPSISVGAGPPYAGFNVLNSERIIFGFYTDPGVSDAVIPMTLPSGISTFVITKGGFPCVIEDAGGCYGSFVEVPALGPGSITVAGGAAADFIVAITSAASPGSGNWQANPPTNADINFIRAIPDIKIVPLRVVSGQPNVTLDADGNLTHDPTVPVSAGTLGVVPSIDSYSWTYIGSDPPGAVVALIDPTSAEPSFTAPLVTEETELTFELTATDDAGLSATEQIIVPVSPPIDAVLLMDTSGSMGWYHDGSTHDLQGGCCSRLASAKSGTEYFIERLSILTTDSRLGVAIFPGEPSPSTVYGDEWYPLSPLGSAADVTAVNNSIGGDTGTVAACGDCTTAPAAPGTPTGIPVNWNGTPTRAGLDAAFDMFPIPVDPEYRSRVILLLSDGEWNIGDDPADTTYLETNFVANDIKIYTLGMGTGSDNVNHTSLQNISVTTGMGSALDPIGFTAYNLGDSAGPDPTEPNLFPFVEKIMADLVSLDFIADPSETIKPKKTNKHKVLVSSHDSLLSFTVSWQSSQTNLLDFYVTAGKTKINPQVSGKGYKNITIDRTKTKKPIKDGEWTIIVTNKTKTNITYNYSVMTKSYLTMRIFLNKALYYTGDTMLIEARLLENNIRFKGQAKVVATIIRPEMGIGDWHRKNEVSKDQLKKFPDKISKEPFTDLEKKKYILQQDKRTKLPKNVHEPKIMLRDDGKKGDKFPQDGIYSGLFQGFVVPGIYKIQITADGKARNNQKFHRETEVQKYVDIKADPRSTVIEGAVVEKLKGNSRIIGIRVTPVDKMKNHLGPGYADKIVIRVYGGKPETEVDDLLNGTYQQFFNVKDINKDIKISVVIKGVKVYNGPFSKLLKNR